MKLNIPNLTRAFLPGLCLSVVALAQCPPPSSSGGGGSGGNQGTPVNEGGPSGPSASGPSSPGPSGPTSPGPGGPSTGGPSSGPRTGGPAPSAPRTGGPGRGMPITLTRSSTSKRRLSVDWVFPVPPKGEAGRTAAAGALPLDDALALMWEKDDDRPLLVLRECHHCQGSDGALLSRSLINDKTMLLTKWFRTVRLPAHVAETRHPFHRLFSSCTTKAGMPHFFLMAHKDAAPVTFSGTQTQSKLWKAMYSVLDARYAKSPKRAVKKWLMLLDRYDTIEGRRKDLREKLLAVRADQGPKSSKAVKLNKQLAELDKDWAKVEAEDRKSVV